MVIIFTLLSVLAADLRGRGSPQIDLLREFRPIGGSGNNRESPDLDLEETPLTSAAINILVPTGDPLFTQATSIAATRDTRSPDTNHNYQYSGRIPSIFPNFMAPYTCQAKRDAACRDRHARTPGATTSSMMGCRGGDVTKS